MKIAEGIEIYDLALFLPEFKTLVIADTHIGIEEAMSKQGILVPRTHFSELTARLGKIIKKINVKFSKIIVNGDIKHEFGSISDTEWRHTLKFIDILAGYANEVVLIKGNHDTILGPIAEKRKIKIKKFEKFGKMLITHGDIVDKDELKNVDTVIIGHEHPAVSISDGVRTETYKCFLKGKFENKTLIVQPSFNLISEGTNILREQLLSPFLKNIKDFEVYIAEGETYHFGKVKKLMNK